MTRDFSDFGELVNVTLVLVRVLCFWRVSLLAVFFSYFLRKNCLTFALRSLLIVILAVVSCGDFGERQRQIFVLSLSQLAQYIWLVFFFFRFVSVSVSLVGI